MAVQTPMAVNAAIEKLLSLSDDIDGAARIIIEYGDKLKSASPLQLTVVWKNPFSGRFFTGHAPGIGNVTIKEKKDEEPLEHTFGIKKERIGYYRLWKEHRGELQFHHFWKSGLTTAASAGDEPETYYLKFDPRTRAFVSFGVLDLTIVFNISWIGCLRRMKPRQLYPSEEG